MKLPRLVGLGMGLSLALGAHRASATGMQGHIYMAECAAEQLAEGPLRQTLFEDSFLWLANGGYFPDSGYTSADHDQGEIPHWEGYVDAYIDWLRKTYPKPLEAPEAREHVAFLFGLAAHGITDSTFDTLLPPRSAQVDPGNPNEIDTSMDVFVVHDLGRNLIPTPAHHEDVLATVFDAVDHPVAPDAIVEAMSTARVGIAAVTNFLAKTPTERLAAHPWAHRAYLDPRTPGGYPFGARVAKRYFEELAKRLEGSSDVDGLVIGTYPDATTPLATLDRANALARVVVFFGHGVDRGSYGAGSVVVLDSKDEPVAGQWNTFRGDQWLNVVTFDPASDWLPGESYRIVVAPTLVTLDGHSPSKPLVFPFEAPCADCTPDLGGNDRPPTLCPLTDSRHPFAAPEPEDSTSSGGATPTEVPPPPAEGCSVDGARKSSDSATLLALVGAVAALGLGTRRRPERRAPGR